ncbi:MAG TPA: hypothetical protein VF669_07270 [Tepidisphaeraceae bacterium]|jgi:hypothetical protein
MHDHNPLSIKFSMPSVTHATQLTPVLVSVSHIVRIVPCYFIESGGQRMMTTVENDAAAAREKGLRRTFMVFDSLGGQYDSASASAAGQSLLERMWIESA